MATVENRLADALEPAHRTHRGGDLGAVMLIAPGGFRKHAGRFNAIADKLADKPPRKQ